MVVPSEERFIYKMTSNGAVAIIHVSNGNKEFHGDTVHVLEVEKVHHEDRLVMQVLHEASNDKTLHLLIKVVAIIDFYIAKMKQWMNNDNGYWNPFLE